MTFHKKLGIYIIIPTDICHIYFRGVGQPPSSLHLLGYESMMKPSSEMLELFYPMIHPLVNVSITKWTITIFLNGKIHDISMVCFVPVRKLLVSHYQFGFLFWVSTCFNHRRCRAWMQLHSHRLFGPSWNPCKVQLDAGYRSLAMF